MNRAIQQIATICTLFFVTACVAEPQVMPNKPTEYLDEVTAATITAVAQPLIFARERRDLAANARDYVTLAAAAVNRSGKIQYKLVTYVWSTVDTRTRALETNNSAIVLIGDDRRIRLAPTGRTAQQHGIAQPIHEPPGPTLAPVVYETDLETLRFLAAARSLAVQLGDDSVALSYSIWDDRRDALAQFVRFLKGER